MRRSGLGLGLSVMLAALVALPAAAQDATPAGTPAAGAASYTITSQAVIGGEGDGVVLALSPDGTAIAIYRPGDDGPGGICSSPTVTRQAPTCAVWDGPAIAVDSVAWSPDGTQFAFTEDGIRFLNESDIWVFDVASGEVTDLTDDGERGPLLRAEDATQDLAPA